MEEVGLRSVRVSRPVTFRDIPSRAADVDADAVGD